MKSVEKAQAQVSIYGAESRRHGKTKRVERFHPRLRSKEPHQRDRGIDQHGIEQEQRFLKRKQFDKTGHEHVDQRIPMGTCGEPVFPSRNPTDQPEITFRVSPPVGITDIQAFRRLALHVVTPPDQQSVNHREDPGENHQTVIVVQRRVFPQDRDTGNLQHTEHTPAQHHQKTRIEKIILRQHKTSEKRQQ